MSELLCRRCGSLFDPPTNQKRRSFKCKPCITSQQQLNHLGKHVVIAERALGRPMPKGVEVHHVDGNRKNNANTNLVICESRSYHKLLHTRQRIIALGGDPNIEKQCTGCKRMLSRALFGKSRPTADGLQNVCQSCHRAMCKDYHSRKRQEAKEAIRCA